MSNFIIEIFDMLLSLLRSHDNIIVFVPFASLFISACICVVWRLIKSK